MSFRQYYKKTAVLHPQGSPKSEPTQMLLYTGRVCVSSRKLFRGAIR